MRCNRVRLQAVTVAAGGTAARAALETSEASGILEAGGRRGLEEADQVLEVFEHLAQLGHEANGECVSNGVLLESQ